MFLQTPLQLRRGPHDEVQREWGVDGNLDARCHAELAARRHDNEDVHVAVLVRGSVGVGAEEEDLVGPELLRYLAREAADERHRDVLAAIPAGFGGFGAGGWFLRHAAILPGKDLTPPEVASRPPGTAADAEQVAGVGAVDALGPEVTAVTGLVAGAAAGASGLGRRQAPRRDEE